MLKTPAKKDTNIINKKHTDSMQKECKKKEIKMKSASKYSKEKFFHNIIKLG